MEINTEITVQEVEDTLLQSREYLGQKMLPDVAKEFPQIKKTEETIVRLHATVEKKGESAAVVRIAEYSSDELYTYSDAPRIEFCKLLDRICFQAGKLRQTNETDIDFELQASELWQSIIDMRNYFGVTPAHDEFITVFLPLADSVKNHVLDGAKVAALVESLESVRNVISLTNDHSDRVEDIFENAGFDLNAPLSDRPYDASIP